MFLASVVVDFRGADRIARGRLADALMARREVVTVKIPGDGASAEYRADVEAPTRAVAREAAVALAFGVEAAVGLPAQIVAVKLQTEDERLRALDSAPGYGPFAA